MQLQQHQASEPVRLGDAFLEDKQWDMEAMVLSTIAGQLEDEEEEEEEVLLDPLCDGDECVSQGRASCAANWTSSAMAGGITSTMRSNGDFV